MIALRRLLLAGLAMLPAIVLAGAYPDTSIRLVVAFPPGGGTDGAARLVAEKLAAELGQAVVVENRAGAGGVIGAQSVARARPDGYTLLFGTGAELLVNPATRKTAPYELLRDFVPVAEVGRVAFALVAPAASANRSLPELVAAAKARPGALNYASFGIGSTNHLIGELFLRAAGIQATHVPFQGSQQAMASLLAGDMDFAFDTAAVVLPQIRAGKLRALATPSPRRLPLLPDVPTLQELGYDGLVTEGWMGVFTPAGTPADIVKTLASALDKVLRAPDLQARLEGRGVAVSAADGPQFTRKLQAELSTWRRVARQANVSLD
ncbi:Bug family tripartite tricarboxylate transporter substrate binding protein [Paracidovorax wautersii]|uniref:Tripartite-type tricarboxylate transporter, receptor component TctC n=1 Tax=Paracidovorax wautersii TaxID=1177982 RepID=A0A1I2BTG9_9BURK|nr:tripartite tricarboxylate transporter substrate binding protein [Paracidovorax wautersii]SFE59436.1 Tripartite-type tricarboxylate transporter, receptor component TctC [Paracidovorax wautersii]